MPNLTLDIDIAADPDRVFAGLTDATAYGAWMTMHAGWPEGPPDFAEGRTFTQDVRMLGRSGQVTWTVDEIDAPSLLVLDGTGPAGLTIRNVYLVEDTDGGAALRCESEFDGGPLPLGGRLGAPIMKKVQAASEESMANFAAMVEGMPQLRRRRRRRFLRWASNARVVEAIEENTRAIDALREEIARSNGRAAPGWLTSPLDRLRR